MEVLSATPRAHVLDLGGASQANIDHIAGAEHRLYAEDALTTLAAAVAKDEPAASFLRTNLSYPARLFDAVLCWDVLAYAPAPYLSPMARRLGEIMKPGGLALAYFPNSAARATTPPGRYTIVGDDVLQRRPAESSSLKEARFLMRREIDHVFGELFLITDVVTKDALHELLLRRRPDEPA